MFSGSNNTHISANYPHIALQDLIIINHLSYLLVNIKFESAFSRYWTDEKTLQLH